MDSYIANYFSDRARITPSLQKGRIRFYRVQDHDDDLFLKCFDYEGGYDQAFAEFSALCWFINCNRDPSFAVIPPRTCLRVGSDRGILVTDYVPLVRADRWLNVAARFPSFRRRILQQIARWIGNFHTMSLQSYQPLDAEQTIEPLIAALTRQASTHGKSWHAETFDGLLDLDGEPCPYGTIHADPVSHNLFRSGTLLVGCDFTLDHQDYLYMDVSKFLISLLWRTRFLHFFLNRRFFPADIDIFLEQYSIDGKSARSSLLSLFLLQSLSIKISDLERKIQKKGGKRSFDQTHIKILLDAVDVVVERL